GDGYPRDPFPVAAGLSPRPRRIAHGFVARRPPASKRSAPGANERTRQRFPSKEHPDPEGTTHRGSVEGHDLEREPGRAERAPPVTPADPGLGAPRVSLAPVSRPRAQFRARGARLGQPLELQVAIEIGSGKGEPRESR